MKNQIFVQIAAYRDPELPKTIQHLFKTAKYPRNIIVGVCHQYCNNDSYILQMSKYENHPNIKMINIPYTMSKGVGWARSLLNQLYTDEKYILQLDSHHRFANNWDVELIEMIENLNDQKAILSSYPYSYFPEKENHNDQYIPDTNCLQIVTDKFVDHNAVLQLKPVHVYNAGKPFNARFLAGGFIFAYGDFVINCPYDPDIYFLGEELTLSIRAFTHGYNLYHPHINLIWHEYTRTNKPKNWEDHNKSKFGKESWTKLNDKSKLRIDSLLFGKKNVNMGKYCLGTKRTLHEYEEYAGVDFKNRLIHPRTLQNKFPPIYIDYQNKNTMNPQRYQIKQNVKDFFQYFQSIKSSEIEELNVVILSQSDNELYRKSYLHNKINIVDNIFILSITLNDVPTKLMIVIGIQDHFLRYVYEYDINLV